MRFTTVTAFLLCVSFAYAAESTCVQDTCEVLVTIDSGPVCGRVLDAGDGTKYYSFRGIPYGKPPVGARRFQELETPDPWEEPLYALIEGPACPQKDLLYGRIPLQVRGQSDDCAYVNVHVPQSASLNCESTDSTGLPVLVKIHGGAFVVGSGNSDLYGPEYMIPKGVIVITFNYRLNVFGFLSLNSAKIPGNAGMRDMVTLLHWVQRNARAFGGNPDDVTLMGQSAGAASAHMLSMSDAAEGLFKRIIMLSGTGIPNFFSDSPAYAEIIANAFLEAAGITSTDPDDIHQQLCEMPLYKIMAANNVVQHTYGFFTFVPTVEQKYANVTQILDESLYSLIGKGRGKDIPILITFTTNEFQDIKWMLTYLEIETRITANPAIVIPTRIALSLSTEEALTVADKIQKRYSNGTMTMDDYVSCVNDAFIKYPSLKLPQWRAEMEGAAPVYVSEFAYKSDMNVLKLAQWSEYESPVHVEDMTFVFHCNSILGPNVAYQADSTDDQMKEWMTTIVTNFMQCSNPTCTDDATSEWPPVTSSSFKLNNNSQPKVISMTEISSEYQDMISFYDSIDSDAKNLTEFFSSGHATSDTK